MTRILHRLGRLFPPGYWDDPRRDEFHLAITGMCLLSGLAYTLSGEAGQALSTMPPLARLVWSWSLLITSVLILIGVFYPQPCEDDDSGYWFELAGMLGLGSLTNGYGAAVVFYYGTGGFGASILFVVGLACYVRSVKLIIKIRAPHETTHKEKVIAEVKKLAEEQARDQLPEEFQ